MTDSIATQPKCYRFGAFELNLATRELRAGKVLVEVQPKVLDLLVYLIDNRDRAVDKNELQDAIWPRQVITEAALTRCLMKARKAIGDDAERQQCIRTVHGTGYHFVADVAELSDSSLVSASAQDGNSGASDAPLSGQSRRPLWLSISAILILICVALTWLWQSEQIDPVDDSDGASIAILPIINATGEARYDWVRLGLMSTLGQVLEAGSSIDVMSSRKAIKAAEGLGTSEADDDSLRQLAAQLHESDAIALILAPVLEQIPGNLRFRYRIVRANGRISERSVVGSDVTEVARAAGADLMVVLGLKLDRTPASTDQFVDEAYIKGRALALQGETQSASDMFKIAVEHDPGAFWPRYEYALTLRDLGSTAEAEALLRTLNGEAENADDPRAHIAAANALAILLWREGNLDEASVLLNAALKAATEHSELGDVALIHSNLCILDRLRGDYTSARQNGLKALETYTKLGRAKPPGYVYHSLAKVAMAQNDYANAETHFHAAIESFRATVSRHNTASALISLADLQRKRGELDDARRLAEESLQIRVELQDAAGEASSRRELGRVEFERGQLGAARKHAEAGLAIANRLELDRELADHRLLLAELDLEQGRLDSAAASLAIALESSQQHQQRRNALDAQLLQVQLQQRLGDTDGAEKLLSQIFADTTDDPELGPLVHAGAGQLAATRGQHQRALSEYERALAAADELANERDLTRYRIGLARAQLGLGQIELAGDQLKAAQALAADHQWLHLAAQVAQAQGNLDEALRLAEASKLAAAERWSDADQRWLSTLTLADSK